MAPEMIDIGGLKFDAVRIRCRVSSSFKSGEAKVLISSNDFGVLPFFVDTYFVSPPELPDRGQEVDGNVRVILLEENNGSMLVEIPGEPVSFGPKIEVSRELKTA